ncbi:MarR family transcriptional regulator [Pseudomonas aeruginosa]|uniref:MarR family winged helix-turn-helix transcriptional regulator n=1 Tax=Pseudomonas aeruginosa TaxID=287 RepID=UPI000FED80D3|nr:MarR family transcriptional regulator [Pseudomonas aeruginosa]RPZ62845.1 MarR family transcriptional regulator [Pseudomonas aeruginosa]
MVESNKTAADTYSLAIFRAIRRLQQAAEIHSKRLSRYGGLTPLQLLILHVLAVEGELTATQLAKLVSLSQASLSGVLDRLEGRGLLYRRRDEQDRRKSWLHLSWLHLDPAGHEALAEAPPLLPEYVIERFAALPEWERHGLLAALLRAADLFGLPEEDVEEE